jgi:peroxiredoxin
MNLSLSRFVARVTLIVFLVARMSSWAAGSEEESTLTKIGQVAPAFKVQTVEGKEFSLEAQRGKVVLVNFFATWCGPCVTELPQLEKEVWQQFKQRGLVVIALGREHENSEVADFQKKNKFTFLMAGDPKRKIYRHFAKQYIPRTYLLNREGKIVYQHVGFAEGDLKELVAAIKAELDRK